MTKPRDVHSPRPGPGLLPPRTDNQPDRQPPRSHPLAAASPPGLCQLRALHPEASAPFTRKGLPAAGGDGRGSVGGWTGVSVRTRGWGALRPWGAPLRTPDDTHAGFLTC